METGNNHLHAKTTNSYTSTLFCWINHQTWEMTKPESYIPLQEDYHQPHQTRSWKFPVMNLCLCKKPALKPTSLQPNPKSSAGSLMTILTHTILKTFKFISMDNPVTKNNFRNLMLLQQQQKQWNNLLERPGVPSSECRVRRAGVQHMRSRRTSEGNLIDSWRMTPAFTEVLPRQRRVQLHRISWKRHRHRRPVVSERYNLSVTLNSSVTKYNT